VHRLAVDEPQQPRERGPDASKVEIERGFSGTLMSKSSNPAGFRPYSLVW
jgi:hypothetical protein